MWKATDLELGARWLGRLRSREHVRELRPGANTELGIDTGQVRLNGAHAAHERSGDLLVRQALGDELGDTPLCRSQLPTHRCSAPDPRKLRRGSLGPALGAKPRESCLCFFECLPRQPLLFPSSKHLAQREQSPRAFERQWNLR